MKRLKKSLAFITTIFMLATLSACNSDNKESSKEESTVETTAEITTEAVTNVEIFKSESITAPFTELNTILKNTIKSYNNPNLAFNVVEVGTETPIYTVENGETTYSIFD